MVDSTNWDVDALYQRLGVSPIINAAGSITRLGGTKTRPETLALMEQAARVMVNIDELNRAAGKEVARLLGAEAGFVCSGAAGGLLLQAAACIAGTDPVKMRQLPNTDGLKNEIVIHTMHRFPYDQAYRAAGAKMVEFGDYLYAHPWQLEGAINDNTAAVAYLASPFSSNKVMPLEQLCEIAHTHDVPVIVDAASMLPPRANLYRYIQAGADMVVYSGGKGVRGPQGSGILSRPRRPDRGRNAPGQPRPVPGTRHEGRQGGDYRPGCLTHGLRGGGRGSRNGRLPGNGAAGRGCARGNTRAPR